MTEIEFTQELIVKPIRNMAHDHYVIEAARASNLGENELAVDPDVDPERFINALMKGRHGSPFEHTAFTFFVSAPIFVFREWQRHRISSFNEMSGRYTELLPKFYIPGTDRKMINHGTKMKPKFSYDRDGAGNDFRFALKVNNEEAWETYQNALDRGISNEVARMGLPLNVYSQMYWTVNARSLMNFISLRIESDDSMFRSYPQHEIDVPAQKVEKYFAEVMPATHKAFVENGRVAP